MSIILKGIDLPNSGQIEIIIRPHGKVFSKTRGISAEAIQIDRPHGRLIDEKIIKENSIDDGYDLYVSWSDIDNAPTILEEEK